MKKLMIALAAIAMAIGAEAAAANWQCTAANIYDGNGASAALWSGNFYIYNLTADVTQQALFDTFKSGGDITSSAIYAGSTSAAGKILAADSKFEFGEQGGGSYSYFFALVDGDKVLFSKTVTQVANGTATPKGLSFGSFAPTSGASSKDLPSETMTIGAWAQAVPEPTSGLLLLLGMAGLALRRRRA